MNQKGSLTPQKPGAMDFMGFPIHYAGVEEVHAFIKEIISKDQKAIALNLNVHCVNLAIRHSWLRDFIRQVSLVFCDGDGVRWGLKLWGYRPPPKITYNKWIWQLSEFCAKEGLRLFLLGSKPGVAEEAARCLSARFSELQIVGVHHGYFQKEGEENELVVREINRRDPQILLVCFGMPAQEKWIRDNWRKLNANVFLKGGAALEYASGRLAKAPEWMIRSHLEWFFRLLQEPQRLFSRYVFGIPYFFFHVFWEKIKQPVRK